MMEYVFVDDLHRYKRLKVTRACESCRRRKVKCDGGSGGTQTPCSSCRKLKIECIFSNMAVKRTHPKTEQEQMDERSQRIENILHKLDEEDSAKGKRGLLDTVKICQTGRAQYIYNSEPLKTDEKRCDFPETVIFTEPPLPFIGFSNPPLPSPELTNNLVQLYFHHIHPYVPIVHKANFLRRLNNKDGNNPLSPLLLYAVLAIASKFSEDPAVRTDPMDPDTAGLAYYNKAK
ncbi:5164_t:CDS:2, partial [Paraglomus occultum]